MTQEIAYMTKEDAYMTKEPCSSWMYGKLEVWLLTLKKLG